jgi:hypothetical protein
MEPRITTSTVAFAHPFLLPGHEAELGAGIYEFLVEEELLQGVSFEAYRRTASWLMVGNPRHPQAPFEMRDVSPRDLDAALDRDRATTDRDGAAPSTPRARS